MRAILLSFLAAFVVLTSAGLGLARGMTPANEAIVICQGHAAVTIWIDANGNEVEHQHLCPEEGSFFKQGAVTGEALREPDRASLTLHTAALRSLLATAPELSSQARGPPLPV